MSFFDDADPPTRTATRRSPRTARTAGAPRRPPQDREAIRRLQLVAAGVAVLVLILIVLGVRSCTSSARKRSLRDYGANVAGLARNSDSKVARPLFQLLSGVGGNAPTKAVELQNQVNNLKVEADDELSRAADMNVPGGMTGAQRAVLLSLELRRDAVAHIAEDLQPALGGTDGGTAVRRIAGEMRAFDASDVVWSQRVIPLVRRGLQDGGVNPADAPVPRMRSLPSLQWLDPTYVSSQLNAAASGTGGPAKPGTHGHGILSVSAGATTLSSTAITRLPASPPPTFTVRFQNQGENNETNVRVRITVSGSGAPITATKTVPETTAGQQATATIPLVKSPPIGTALTLKAEVLPVPGEKKTDNNSQTFQVLFTR